MINLYRDIDFKKYLWQSILIFCGFLVLGMLIGYFVPHNVTAIAVEYTMSGSASAKVVNISDDVLFKFVVYFFNNAFVALLFAVLMPLIYYRNLKDVNSINVNPIWISRFGLSIQAGFPGILIGYAIPLINNNLLIVTALVPHGIIEISAILIAAAMGIWFVNGKYLHIIGYKGLTKLYVVYILPMVFVAAAIEAYVTPWLMSLVK